MFYIFLQDEWMINEYFLGNLTIAFWRALLKYSPRNFPNNLVLQNFLLQFKWEPVQKISWPFVQEFPWKFMHTFPMTPRSFREKKNEATTYQLFFTDQLRVFHRKFLKPFTFSLIKKLIKKSIHYLVL